MLADDEGIWYSNDPGDEFERKYRRAIVIGLCMMTTVLGVVIAIFYVGALLTEGLAQSMMNAMLLIVVLTVFVVLTLVAVHKIRWGRTVPRSVGLSEYGIWFEYKTGKRVFVSANRLLGARRVQWMGLDQIILVHWGYLPMPDGKFVTEEIAQLVIERFQLRRYRLPDRANSHGVEKANMSLRVMVVDYDPRWPVLYEEEKNLILSVVGDIIVAIEHIGSTAVPGLGGKPVIDIMVAVHYLADADRCIEPLERIGFEYVPEHEVTIPERRYFRKGPQENHRHLHMVQLTSHFWKDHLLFRDYLRSNPEVASQYCQLKKELATRHRTDPRAYTDGKAQFIESKLSKARGSEQ